MKRALALVLALAGPARGDVVVPDKARAFADDGRAAHGRGDYARAIESFKDAYVLAPAPALLFNLGQAYRLHGDCDDAALMYRRYLQSSPPPPPEEAALATTQLAAVEQCARERVSVVANVEPTPRGRLAKRLGIASTLVGVAALGVAGYEQLGARDASQRLEAAYGKGGHAKDVAAIDAEGRRDAELARGFAIAGSAAIAGGIAMYLLGVHEERAVVVTPSASGPRVGVAWRF